MNYTSNGLRSGVGIALFTFHKYRTSIDSKLSVDSQGNTIAIDDLPDSVHEVNLELSAANMRIGHQGDGHAVVCGNRLPHARNVFLIQNATKQGSDDTDSNRRLLVCGNRLPHARNLFLIQNATKRQGSDDTDSNHRLLFATDDDPEGEEDAEEVRSTQFSKFNHFEA
jgi:solute carrier family 35 protein C2